MRVHSRELHRGVSLMISKQKMKCEIKKASTQFDAACNQIKYFIELRCEKQGELYSNIMVAEQWKFPYANEHVAHHEKKCLTESDTRPDQVEVIVHWSK